MTKKRTVILFGAGAVIPWGSPKTPELTNLIKDSAPHFVCNDNKTKIIELIFDTLKLNGYTEKEINFETLINVVDELIVYYSYNDNANELPSFSKTFFSSRLENMILNFSIEGGEKKHLYKLEIPKGKKYDFSRSSYNNESPEQFYFQHLLTVLLTNINAQISKYSYHTEGNTKIFSEDNIERNKNFQTWLKSLSDKAVLRMYTLNYDRLFKVLAERINIPVFEGFDCNEFVPQHGIVPNIKKIHTDFDSNIHYNLHGSAFWNVYPRDPNNQLLSTFIKLHPVPNLNLNNHESSVLQIEKGKSILISNIITGFQKTQKSYIAPFKQMQAAFDKDCCLSDELIIVGYSFGDAHINESIKTALIYNPELKLHFIDPVYDECGTKKGYDILAERLIHIFPSFMNKEKTLLEYSDNNTTCTYFNKKLTVTSLGFDEYLISRGANLQKVGTSAQ